MLQQFNKTRGQSYKRFTWHSQACFTNRIAIILSTADLTS